MKIIVTGSSGFIGFHLTKKLLSLGHEVIGVDDHNDYYDIKLKELRSSTLKNARFRLINQDINSLDFDASKVDLAINLAAQAGIRVEERKRYLYKHSNIDGFENFCSFCLKNNIKKIIYASSSAVYSDKGHGKFIEGVTPLEPKSEYGKSKLMNENYASYLSSQSEIKFIGLRFFSVYGPYGRPDMAYCLFSEALRKEKVITLNNNGRNQRDMTYIDDIIAGIISSINLIFSKREHPQHQIINLGNDKPISSLFLLKTIEKKLSKKAILNHQKT